MEHHAPSESTRYARVEQSLPDYSTYSLFDLRDAYARISRATFPERAGALRAEIARREAGPAPSSGAQPRGGASPSLFGVAGFLLATPKSEGVFGFAHLGRLIEAGALGEAGRIRSRIAGALR